MGVLVGTKRLFRLALRRDRISIPLTLLLVIGMTGASAPALVAAYPDYESQLGYVASSVTSAVGRMFQGTIQGVSLGSILTAETFMFTAVILAIMSIFIVSRHTRLNEEMGAAELIGSMRVGRNSPLSAALLWAILANLAAAALMFAFLASVPELDKTGSFFFSISLAMCGIFFAGVSAITVQLSDYRRGANLMAIAVLAVAFLIRAVGDMLGEITPDGLGVTASWLSWLSPLGWANQVLPYYENRIFPLILLLVGFMITAGVGYLLLNHRDLGSSIIPAKAGRPRAKKSLLKTDGLAHVLHRPAFLAWLAGAILWGGMMGFIVDDFRTTFEENEAFQDFFAVEGGSASYVEMMFGSMLPLLGIFLAGYVVSAMAKTQDEEGYGRLEFLLSTALSRTKWLFSHIRTIVIGMLIMLGSLGFFAAAGYYIATDEREMSFLDIFLSGISSAPAMLLFMAIVLVVFAVYGRFVKTFAWAYFAYCALIGTFASMFKWPEWTLNLSPFSHTPVITADDYSAAPFIVMTLLALIVGAFAFAMFNRRNLNLK